MSDSPATVLVVDDEAEVRALTCRALRDAGLTCDQAGDGEQAIRLLSTRPYEALVTDLRMPRRHGHSLCTEALRLPQPPHVLVLTALTDARIVRDLMGRGVHDVVQKPVAYDLLATKVQAMLRQARPRTAVVAAPPRRPAAKKANLLHKIEDTLVELTDLFGERLDTVFDYEDELAEPPKAIRDFIRRLAENEMVGVNQPRAVVLPEHEARVKDRVTCYTTAIARPVDRQWEPCGEPFKLALRDLSESGARLLYTRAVSTEFLALSWNATQLVAKSIRVVCQVRRCKPCGPFYDVGGQFVMAD